MGDRADTFGANWGFTMRVIIGVTSAAALALVLAFGADSATAQERSTGVRISGSASTDISAQARRERRPATRLRVERYQRLPSTAVRTCDAWYAQERRPSGTVIVPKLSCRWISG